MAVKCSECLASHRAKIFIVLIAFIIVVAVGIVLGIEEAAGRERHVGGESILCQCTSTAGLAAPHTTVAVGLISQRNSRLISLELVPHGGRGGCGSSNLAGGGRKQA